MIVPAGSQQQVRDTELLSSGLGVLINLAEGAAPLRKRLAAAPVTMPAGSGTAAAECSAADGGAVPLPATLVALLCRLVSHTMQPCPSPRCGHVSHQMRSARTEKQLVSSRS